MFCFLYTGPCPPGMEAHTAVCQPCPVGKYRDSLELTGCLDCPYGMSTLGTHSRNQSECLGMCFIYQNNKHYFKITEIEDLTWLIISYEMMMSVRFCLLSVCFSNDFVVLKIEIVSVEKLSLSRKISWCYAPSDQLLYTVWSYNFYVMTLCQWITATPCNNHVYIFMFLNQKLEFK